MKTIKKNIAILFGGHSSEYSISLQSAAAVIRHLDTQLYQPILVGIDQGGRWFRFYGGADAIEADTWQGGPCVPAVLSPDPSHHGLLEFHSTVPAAAGVPNNAGLPIADVPDIPNVFAADAADGPYNPAAGTGGFSAGAADGSTLWSDGAQVSLTHIDAAFPVLHGKNGEDGTVQGLLSLAGIPYVGCGLLASALCMDKDVAHRLAKAAGVRVPRSVVLYDNDPRDDSTLAQQVAHLGYPLFIKPANAGSSFGITRVIHSGQLVPAVNEAFAHDYKVIIEEAIDGFEVGCAILGHEKLIVGAVDEIELTEGFFDFTEKYTLKTSRIHMPARISPEDANRIKSTAVTLYRALECSGFARVDLFFTKNREIVFNEINTIPGFTAHSRYPGMMKGIGLDFKTLLQKLLEVSL